MDMRLSRRGFLRVAAAVGTALALKGSLTPPPESSLPEDTSPEPEPVDAGVETKEQEPDYSAVPRMVDFTPLELDLVDAQENNLLSQDVEPFKIESFFNRLTGADFQALENEFRQKAGDDQTSLLDRDGISWLLSQNKELEAVAIAASLYWSGHGLGVARTMASIVEHKNNPPSVSKYYEVATGKEVNPVFDVKPGELNTLMMEGKIKMAVEKVHPEHVYEPETYEMSAFQNYIQKLEKSEETDQFGNPYYLATVDHVRLAQDLKELPDSVLCFAGNVGKIKIRLGYALPEGELDNLSSGWLQRDRQQSEGKDASGRDMYMPPVVAVESAYDDEESLHALNEFLEILSDKVVVTAAGNSEVHLSENFQLRQNGVLVAAFDARSGMGEKPVHNFEGHPGQVYYVDPAIVTGQRYASDATAVTAWNLSKLGANSENVQEILQEHSKVKVDGNWQVSDFGIIPADFPGDGKWEDEKQYRSWES